MGVTALTNSALLEHFFIEEPGDGCVEADAALTEMSDSSHTGLNGDDEPVPPTSQCCGKVGSKNGFSPFIIIFLQIKLSVCKMAHLNLG